MSYRRLAHATLVVMLTVAACTFLDPLDRPGIRILIMPPDTSLYVGATYQARGRMENSYGDLYPSTHIAYVGLDPSIDVRSNGEVTGLAYGRGRVVALRGGLADTGWVGVVPVGTLALIDYSGAPTLAVVNVDGSGLVAVTSAGQSVGGAPAWLPGDAGLVYEYAVPGGGGTTQIFVADSFRTPRLLVSFGQDPRVARDGSWIYYSTGGAVWRVHPDGAGAEVVSAAGDYQPDPSPDGTRLAFSRIDFPPTRIWIVIDSLADSAMRVLVPDGQLPRWAPGGGQLAYLADDSAGTMRIFVVGADGTGTRQVSAPGHRYRPQGLDWSADGQWLLARSDTTLDLIQVTTGLTLPLSYAGAYSAAAWKW